MHFRVAFWPSRGSLLNQGKGEVLGASGWPLFQMRLKAIFAPVRFIMQIWNLNFLTRHDYMLYGPFLRGYRMVSQQENDLRVLAQETKRGLELFSFLHSLSLCLQFLMQRWNPGLQRVIHWQSPFYCLIPLLLCSPLILLCAWTRISLIGRLKKICPRILCKCSGSVTGTQNQLLIDA